MNECPKCGYVPESSYDDLMKRFGRKLGKALYLQELEEKRVIHPLHPTEK